MPDSPRVLRTAEFVAYREYVNRLDTLAVDAEADRRWKTAATAALNGQAASELRNSVSLAARREFGAFFTGSKLAGQLLARASRAFDARNVFFDPTMGAGDLLLAAARKLPLARTFESTLRTWGQALAGTDLHAPFIDAAKIRLVLLARQRHSFFGPLPNNWRQLFPNIHEANGLLQSGTVRRATCCLLNPPYGFTESPSECRWAGGRVSEAAIFVTAILEQMTARAEMLAILPEVLRSGSFYNRWREHVSALAEVSNIRSRGIFDESADVDVFTVRLIRRADGSNSRLHRWPAPRRAKGTETVADFFKVHVGRVVPHRDAESGPSHPFIHPRGLPPWEEIEEFAETRRFDGVTYQPPFVAIRRTSRPGHPYRATATLILGKHPVAVENHLIVCQPKDGTKGCARALIRQLKTTAVNAFLDRRIRCRHLTVGAVSAIPFRGVRTRSRNNE